MTTPIGLPNYQQLRGAQVGVEAIRGAGAIKTNKWYGRFDITRRQPLAESEEFAATFFADYTPVRGAVIVDGTYYQHMAYEDAHLLRYAVKGGVAGVSDGESDPGYTYAFRHSGSRDDLDTASVEYIQNPGIIYLCNGLIIPEFTLSGDIDDPQAVWKFNSRIIALNKDLMAALEDVAATSGSQTTFVKTGWAQTIDALIGRWAHFKTGTAGNLDLFREVLDNDATTLTLATLPSAVQAGDTIDLYPLPTAGIADRERETVKGPGTKIYLADYGDTIGDEHQVRGRAISFSVTAQLNAAYKRFMENVDTMSSKADRGMVRVTGQLRLEMDRRREWDKYVDMAPELIRIAQTGSVIDVDGATTKEATIDIFRAVWDDPTPDVRGNNNTMTWPFRGYVDVGGEGVPAEWTFKNELSALLA